MDDAVSRAALVRLVAKSLARIASGPPLGAWVVPGRVEIFGKHTDYAGGRSLVAALPRGMAVIAAPRDDGRVRVVDARDGRQVELEAASDPRRAWSGWANYVAAVVTRLAANFPGADFGADLAFASDLPRAAGMSSSSALVVSVGLALMARAGLEQREEWAASIEDELDLAGYFGAIENGATFRTLAGSRGVGTFGGSQDHTAILTCRSSQVSMFQYMPVRRLADVPMPERWQFVLMTSGVHASKSGALRDRYNTGPRAVAALLEIWNREMPASPASSLAALIASGPDAAALLRDRASAGHAGFTGAELVRRLDHFVTEDARVAAASAAFLHADCQAVGDLSRASQASAESELGNQVRETTVLAGLAREHGAFAASSFGAGFGGSIWALVEGDAASCERMAVRWRTAYLDACPHVAGVEWFVARPGPPATRIDSAHLHSQA